MAIAPITKNVARFSEFIGLWISALLSCTYQFAMKFTLFMTISNVISSTIPVNITNNNFLNMTQSNFAYMCLNQALFQLGLTNLLIIEQVACVLCNVQNGMSMNFNVMKAFPHAFQNKNLVSCSPFSSLYRL